MAVTYITKNMILDRLTISYFIRSYETDWSRIHAKLFNFSYIMENGAFYNNFFDRDVMGFAGPFGRDKVARLVSSFRRLQIKWRYARVSSGKKQDRELNTTCTNVCVL